LSLLFKGLLPTSQRFLDEEHQLCAKQPLSSEYRSTVALRRKARMLGGRKSSSMLSSVNGAC
jgi:hypothetical protein